MSDYFVPYHKWQCIEWLVKYWPEDEKKFKRMRRLQLREICKRKIKELRP